MRLEMRYTTGYDWTEASARTDSGPDNASEKRGATTMASYMIEAMDRVTGTWTFDGVCTESVEDCSIDTEADAVKLVETMRGWTGWENGHYRVVEVEMGHQYWPGYTVVREVAEFTPIVSDEDDDAEVVVWVTE